MYLKNLFLLFILFSLIACAVEEEKSVAFGANSEVQLNVQEGSTSLVLKRFDGVEAEKYELPIINQATKEITLVDKDTKEETKVSYTTGKETTKKGELVSKTDGALKIGSHSIVFAEEAEQNVILSPIGGYNITAYFEKNISGSWNRINNVSLKPSCNSDVGCYQAFDEEASGIETYRLVISSSLPYGMDNLGPYFVYGQESYRPDVNDICSWYEEINETDANWANCVWDVNQTEIDRLEPLNVSVFLNTFVLTFNSNGSIDPTYEIRPLLGGGGVYGKYARGEAANYTHLQINGSYPYNDDATFGTFIYVPFDGDDNQTSADFGTGDFDGTYGTGAFTDSDGVFGNAVNFTGNSTSYIDLGTQVKTATSLYAYSMWVKIDAAPADTEILFYNGNAGTSGYGLQLLNTGLYRLLHGGVAFITVGQGPTANVWDHIAVMRHGGDVFVCRNGVLINTTNAVYNAPNGRSVIGANNAFSANFDGMIDDFQMYSQPVNCDDMLAIYNNQSYRYRASSNVTLAFAKFNQNYNLANYSLNKIQTLEGSNLSSFHYNWNISKGYDELRSNTPGNLTQDLVAYLHFDGDLLDSSGVGNNGSAGVTGALPTGQGRFEESLVLDGSDDMVTLNELPFVGGSSTPTVFTFSVWLNRSAAQPSSGQSRIFTQEHSGNNGGNLYIMMDNAGTFTYDVFEPGGGTLTTTESFSNNQWYHLVVTRNGTLRTIYVDGIIKARDTSAETYVGASSISEARIGGTHDVHFFNGQLDEMMFWNRTLGQDEVQQIYTQGRAKWALSGKYPIESDFSIQNITMDSSSHSRIDIEMISPNGFYTPLVGTNYNITVGNQVSGAPPADSCSPDGLSAHTFLCSDNCLITSTINFNNNSINISGAGTLNITGQIYNFSAMDRSQKTGICYITSSQGIIGK